MKLTGSIVMFGMGFGWRENRYTVSKAVNPNLKHAPCLLNVVLSMSKTQ